MSQKGGRPYPSCPLVARWATVADVPARTLPPIPAYECLGTAAPPRIDGVLDDDVWGRAPRSEPFASISDGIRNGYETRVALHWDGTHLYAAYRVTDRDVRAASTVHHGQKFMTDDDVEVFVQGDGGY